MSKNLLVALFERIPLFEVFVISVLAIITIFRRRLSSNDEYRDKPPPAEAVVVRTLSRSSKARKGSGRARAALEEASRRAAAAESAVFGRLSSEVLMLLLAYLPDLDIARLRGVSRALRAELGAERVWEQLWKQTYGQMWCHPLLRSVREGRGITWDPFAACDSARAPPQGWFRFYCLFEVCWMDWLLAGSCTPSRCLLGFHNDRIVDVTAFISTHPGSPETLTEGAGCDATDTFTEIGHSSNASKLLNDLVVWRHGQAATPLAGGPAVAGGRNASLACRRSSRLVADVAAGKKSAVQLALVGAAQPSSRAAYYYQALAAIAAEAEIINAVSSALGSHAQRVRGPSADGVSGSLHAALNLMSFGQELQPEDDEGEGEGDGEGEEGEYDIDSYSSTKRLGVLIRRRKDAHRGGVYQTRNNSAEPQGQSPLSNLTRAPPGGRGPPHSESLSLGPAVQMVAGLTDNYPCPGAQPSTGASENAHNRHFGNCKAYLDPLTLHWTVWWSCCGQGKVVHA